MTRSPSYKAHLPPTGYLVLWGMYPMGILAALSVMFS